MSFLAPGPHIAERLKAKVPSAEGHIFTTKDLAGVKEKSQVTPALHVIFHSPQPVSTVGDGDTRWQAVYLVVAVVKNVRQNVGVEELQRDADPLLLEAIAALSGWKCPDTLGKVKPIPGPGAVITDGFGYFPLAFATEVATGGADEED